MKKNIFVIVLCALMVFGSIPKSVKAEETEGSEAGIFYTVDNPENNINEPNHGNIDSDEDDAIHLEVEGEGSEIVIGAKNVSSSDDDGVSVDAFNKGTATVTVENVKAEDDAILVDVRSQGNTNITTGDIEAGFYGIYVRTESGGTATITTGDIVSEYEGIIGMLNQSNNVTINTGSITSNDDRPVNIESYSSKVNLTVDGDITSKEIGNTGMGIRSGAYEDEAGSEVNVNVNGNITGTFNGIKVSSYEEAISNITVSGDVITNNNEIDPDDTRDGIDARSFYDGTTNINVSGNVVGTDSGINVLTDTGGKTVIVVEGDVKAEGTAISVDDYGDPMEDTVVSIIVNGNISGGDGANLYADSNAIVSLITEGSISGTDSIILNGRDEAEFVVEAKDIEGTDIGVYSNLLDDSSSLIVADTIKGDEVAIALSTDEDQSSKDIQVVAWKIELNKNGNVAENMNALRITSPNEEFEKNNILYVLKLEQPEEGGDIALDMEREIDTFYDDEAWGTANEGTKVYVNVNLKEGYMITGLYNGKGEKQELEKDDKGYYIVVPKGGGVYLTASLKYSIIDKTEGSHELGSNESYFVEIDAPIDEYESTWVDNKNVSKYATVTEGSTIVTLDPSFLNTLAIGWHDLMVRFTSGREIFSRFEITGTAPSNTTNTTDFKIPTTGIEDMSHRYKGYSVALFAIVSSIAIIKSKKAYKVR